MVSYITYANQSATRNRPLSDDLIKRLAYLEKMGVQAEVFSGGQPGKDEGGPRVGSTRHDHGGAGDVFFYKDGRKLDWANPDDLPIFKEIVSQGKANGITGFGAGDGYMQQGSMHIGMGSPGVWGAGGKSTNAPGWLREAYGMKVDPVDSTGKPDVIAEVIAAADPKQTPALQAQASAMATPTPSPEDKPKSHNGILVDAYNKLTGQNVQVPKTILGADTDKVADGFTKFGEFSKLLMENDQALNNQIAARSGGARQVTPVEMQFLSSLPKKKKGALGGLGGYLI